MTPITDKPTDIELRIAVELQVGSDKMKDFEIWAFSCSPVQYTEDIIFLWDKSRSTYHHIPGNYIDGLIKIISLWKKK